MFARAEVVFTIIWQGVLLCILFFILGYMYPENGVTRGFSCCKIMSFFKDAGWWCYAAVAMSQFSVEVDMAKFWILFSVVVHVFPRSSVLVGFLADFEWLTWCHLVACWVVGMIFSSVSWDDGSSSSSATINYEEHCQNQGYPLSLERGATSAFAKCLGSGQDVRLRKLPGRLVVRGVRCTTLF